MEEIKKNRADAINKKLVEDFIRYLISGVSSVGVQFGILMGLIEVFNINATLASGTGFVLGCVANYLLLYYWAFSSQGKHLLVAIRYTVVMTITLAVNVVIFWYLNDILLFGYSFSQAVAIAATSLGNYLLNRKYTFNCQRKTI